MMALFKRRGVVEDEFRLLNQIWTSLAIFKYVIVILLIILISLDQAFHVVYDDFTPAFPVNDTTPNLPSTTPRTVPKDGNKTFVLLKKNSTGNENSTHDKSHRKHRNKQGMVHLTDLLIMYPCCTTILTILLMEMLGHSFGEPMSKFTNLFLIGLCILLGVAVFVVTLLVCLRTIHEVIVAASALALVFILFEIIDFIILFRVL